MFALLLPFCFFGAEGLSILPLSSFKDCPTIPVPDNLQIEQLTGSWRLAYLFFDGQDDFEEDDTCVVTEFTRLSDTKMSINVYVDKKEDLFIDRSIAHLHASLSSPGEWLLHSNLSREAFFQVTVISSTKHQMILTFCISNAVTTGTAHSESIKFGNYRGLHRPGRDGSEKRFGDNPTFDPDVDSGNDLAKIFGRSNLRVKRNPHRSGKYGEHERLNFFESDSTNILTHGKLKKHFWTVILVKDNNNSALNFVENASLLMKLGFDLTEGNLVSFGRCGD